MAFVWGLTKETIHLPLGGLQGGLSGVYGGGSKYRLRREYAVGSTMVAFVLGHAFPGGEGPLLSVQSHVLGALQSPTPWCPAERDRGAGYI